MKKREWRHRWDERGEDINEKEDEDGDFSADEEAFYDTDTVIFDRKGKKILLGDKDEHNDEDSDYLPDEEDDSIGHAEQYEVEVTQNKDHYGADREARENEAPVGSEDAKAPDRGDGGSKSTETGKPIELKKRKGVRPRKNENVFGGSDCNITDVVESYYSNYKSLHKPVNSEDEDEVSSISKHPSCNEETNMSNHVPQIGMKFEEPS